MQNFKHLNRIVDGINISIMMEAFKGCLKLAKQ